MDYEESMEQLKSLIEHFNNGGSDFNATDIEAIKYLLKQSKKQKEVIDNAIEYVEWNKDKAKFDNNTKEYDNYTFLNEENIDELLDILKEVSE